LARLDLLLHRLVEQLMILAVEIFAVALGREAHMSVGGNYQVAIHLIRLHNPCRASAGAHIRNQMERIRPRTAGDKAPRSKLFIARERQWAPPRARPRRAPASRSPAQMAPLPSPRKRQRRPPAAA